MKETMRNAQYLLRFDDICPGMNWRVWDQIERLLYDQGIKPVLAVIPDNRDETLQVFPPNGSFWNRVRDYQSSGWTLAMHGWQHRYVTKSSGILGINNYSEFAGLPRFEQEHKLRSGRLVLEREGIDTSVWIAPAHSFDTLTIQLLRDLGFRYISDGFFPLPHVDEFGMTWVPQQLWSFRRRPFGIWTICFHINNWGSSEMQLFQRSLEEYAPSIADFNSVTDQYKGRRKSALDDAAARTYRCAASVKAVMRRMAAPFQFRPAV